MIDEKIHNFYMYFTMFLAAIVVFLTTLLYFLNTGILDSGPQIEVDENFAIFETNFGEIKIELFFDKTPNTAEHFAKLVKDGFYDRTKFHLLIKGFVLQGGDPNSIDSTNQGAWGGGNAGYFIDDEYETSPSNTQWTVAMANDGPGTASSQFFINLDENTHLDYNKEPKSSAHTVFGKIVEGFEVIEVMADQPTHPVFKYPNENQLVYRAYMSEK